MQPKKITPRNTKEVSVRSVKIKKKPKQRDSPYKQPRDNSPYKQKQSASEPGSDGEALSKNPFESPSKGLGKNADYRQKKPRSNMEKNVLGKAPKALRPFSVKLEPEKLDSATATGGDDEEKKPEKQEQKSQGHKDPLAALMAKLKNGVVIQANSGNNFVIKKLLGHGGFGAVWQVHHQNGTQPDNMYALKIELKQEGKKSQMKRELAVYQDIAEAKKKAKEGEGSAPFDHLAELFDYGTTSEWKFLVMPLFGPSLQDIRMKLGGGKKGYCFPRATVMMIAKQTLEAIIHFHKLGWVHSDLKPQNLVIGCGSQQPFLFLLDFGIARKVVIDDEMIQQRKRTRFVGTWKYASINAHEGYTQSFRDDLESYIYVVLDFGEREKNVPWIHRCVDSKNINLVKQMKQEFMNGSTFRHPRETPPNCTTRLFFPIVDYIYKLKYDDTPDYDWLQLEILRIAIALGVNFKDSEWTKHDWDKLMAENPKGKKTKKGGKKRNEGDFSTEDRSVEDKSRDSIRVKKIPNDNKKKEKKKVGGEEKKEEKKDEKKEEKQEKPEKTNKKQEGK